MFISYFISDSLDFTNITRQHWDGDHLKGPHLNDGQLNDGLLFWPWNFQAGIELLLQSHYRHFCSIGARLTKFKTKRRRLGRVSGLLRKAHDSKNNNTDFEPTHYVDVDSLLTVLHVHEHAVSMLLLNTVWINYLYFIITCLLKVFER